MRAVKILAEQGAPGECENARRLLERLANKYGISVEEITEEKKELHWFRYSQEIERRLLNQIIYMITGKPASGCVGTMSGRKRKELGTHCTEAERIEIESNYAFYKAALQEELDIFMSAFASKNALFPPPEIDTVDGSGKTNIEKARRALAMMAGMGEHIKRKALPEQTKTQGAEA